MSNKLLEQIKKKNNEEFDDFMLNEYGKWKISRIEAKSYLTQSGIKEIKALIDILGKKKRNTSGRYHNMISYSTDIGYNLALDDIIKILKETKEELEKLN